MSLLDALNSAQREAAEAISGPLLVLAGAGSGKTRVLTYRIAHLLRERGVSPWRILAVTFTNKAAGEMQERLEHLVGPRLQQLWIGTFHSICARLLRLEAEAFGLDPRFTIYDEDDRRALVRRLLQVHQIDERDLAPRAFIAQLSRAKNAMLDPQLLAQEAGSSPHRRRFAELYAAYEAEMRRNHAFDFDDLLVETVRQFEKHPEVLARYQERFCHILVDEYQDTNRPQYLLCRLLAARHRNLCCVGDDDQSIYQFRGADLRNILDFEQDYPDAKVVRLEQNYRSTARILEVANAVIRHNQSRKGKKLWTQARAGELIEVVECDTDRQEARFVVDTLRRLIREEGYAPGDLAILYRTHAQSRPLEEELQRSGMPYVIVGSIRFYERQEIKDLLAYLRLLANPADDASLLRIVNLPRRGIGETSIERLVEYARQRGLSLLAALDQLDQVPALTSRTRQGLERFGQLIGQLTECKATLDLAALGQAVCELSGYRKMLQEEGTPEAEVRSQNVDQLIAFMTEFAQTREDATLESFLEEVALMAPVDEMRSDREAIALMTLHSAKGLEFPVVFICGLEENLFPTARAIEESYQNPQAIEEERRLCYVGITRAQERLFLTYACRRYAFGSLFESLPSRFLNEVPPDLVRLRREGVLEEEQPATRTDRESSGRWKRGKGPLRQPRKSELAQLVDQDDSLAVGQWVRHPTWGRGQILAREGNGAGLRLSIRFGEDQVKKVAVAYAQLEPD